MANDTDLNETSLGDSFRPFGGLDESVDNDLRQTLFSFAVAFAGLGLIACGWLAWRAWGFKQMQMTAAMRHQIICIIGLLGVGFMLADTACAVWFLPGPQTVWSIAFGFIGFSATLFIFVPHLMTHHMDQPAVNGRSKWLVLLTLMLFLTGVGLMMAYWIERHPIFGVAVTYFVWQAVATFFVAGITVWRNVVMGHIEKGVVPGLRFGIFVLFWLGYITVYSMENPQDLLLRMFEVLALVIVEGVILWTAMGLDGMKLKDELPTTTPLFNGEY